MNNEKTYYVKVIQNDKAYDYSADIKKHLGLAGISVPSVEVKDLAKITLERLKAAVERKAKESREYNTQIEAMVAAEKASELLYMSFVATTFTGRAPEVVAKTFKSGKGYKYELSYEKN